MAEAEKEAWDEDWRVYDLPGPGRVLLCENCSDHEERVLDEEGPLVRQSDTAQPSSRPHASAIIDCPG